MTSLRTFDKPVTSPWFVLETSESNPGGDNVLRLDSDGYMRFGSYFVLSASSTGTEVEPPPEATYALTPTGWQLMCTIDQVSAIADTITQSYFTGENVLNLLADASSGSAGLDANYLQGKEAQQFLSSDTVDEKSGGLAFATTGVPFSSSINLDFSLNVNFELTLDGNATLEYPSNVVPGQSGRILVSQDNTGNRTLAFAGGWVFPGSTTPVLTSASQARDMLVYEVLDGGNILVNVVSNIGTP